MQRVERVALRMCKIQESRSNKSCSTIRTQAREFPTYINILERLTKDELRQYKLLHVSMQALFFPPRSHLGNLAQRRPGTPAMRWRRWTWKREAQWTAKTVQECSGVIFRGWRTFTKFMNVHPSSKNRSWTSWSADLGDLAAMFSWVRDVNLFWSSETPSWLWNSSMARRNLPHLSRQFTGPAVAVHEGSHESQDLQLGERSSFPWQCAAKPQHIATGPF